MHHLFLNESGNHSLSAFEPTYPVFVLGGVIIHEADLQVVNASVRAFKQDTLGDDSVVLHTADIARNRRGFERLADSTVRCRFYSGLNSLMTALHFTVIACAIDKPRLVERYGSLALARTPSVWESSSSVSASRSAQGGRAGSSWSAATRASTESCAQLGTYCASTEPGSFSPAPSVGASSRSTSAARPKRWPDWSSPTSSCRRLDVWWQACPAAPTPMSSSASYARGQAAAGREPGWSYCPKRKAGDRYAVPDHDQCRRDPAACQSTDG